MVLAQAHRVGLVSALFTLFLLLTKGLLLWYTSSRRKLRPGLWPGLFFCARLPPTLQGFVWPRTGPLVYSDRQSTYPEAPSAGLFTSVSSQCRGPCAPCVRLLSPCFF